MEDDLATSVGMTAEQAAAVKALDVLTDEHRSEVDDNRIIAALARENHELKVKVERLERDERLRREWTDQAKRDAGFHVNATFDDVWAKALEALRQSERK